MTIATLIDKQDTFEIIRDQIAAILKVETASQMQLATDGGKDPALWDLKVYTERSNPFESFLNESSATPIVNVWYDNSSFDGNAGNIIERQQTDGVFNIDCYGYGKAKDEDGGHSPGDREAAFEVQRALRLVRNILMAAEYVYLGLARGVVGKRWPQSIEQFQPQLGDKSVQQIVGARIAFRVRFNEFSPQVEAETLEYLSATVFRAEDGEILLQADYDYTTP